MMAVLLQVVSFKPSVCVCVCVTALLPPRFLYNVLTSPDRSHAQQPEEEEDGHEQEERVLPVVVVVAVVEVPVTLVISCILV